MNIKDILEKNELTKEDKIKELENKILYLEAENEYLKKLNALVQEEELVTITPYCPSISFCGLHIILPNNLPFLYLSQSHFLVIIPIFMTCRISSQFITSILFWISFSACAPHSTSLTEIIPIFRFRRCV